MTTKKIVLVIGAVVVVLGLLVVLFVGGIAGFALYQVGNSQAALKAKDFLRNSEKLKSEIGDVKDFGSIVTASVRRHDGNGEVMMSIEVLGEDQTIINTIHIVMVSGSAWRVSSATYVNQSGQTVELLDPYDSKILTPRLIA